MKALAALSAVLLCASATSQSTPAAAPAAAAAPQGAAPAAPPVTTSTGPENIVSVNNSLPSGTAVKLRLTENLSSHDAKAGQRVPFEVIDEVDVNGVLVIAKGAPAVGTVTMAEPKKTMGRAGKLDVTIDSVRLVDGESTALGATKSEKGGGHTGAMTAGMIGTALVFFPAAPLLLFIHGKDITIPEGTLITAFTQGDTRIDTSKFAAGSAVAAVGTTGGIGTSSTATQTALTIDASVPSADITVDGNLVGQTPATLTLAPGAHKVTVSKKGYSDWTRQLTTTPGTIHLSADMTQAQ